MRGLQECRSLPLKALPIQGVNEKAAALLVVVVVVLGVYQALIFYDDNFKYGHARNPAVRPAKSR
jgi:hypothetical protein